MHAKWDALTVAALVVGVIAVSSSGALIAYAAAPALAIAFWRNALAAGVLAPVTLVTRRKELAGLNFTKSALAGLALAVHFGTWVPSVKLTTIATSTALVCTQPIWAALLTTFQGVRPGRWVWTGMAVAMVGVAVATGADFRVGGTAILGDLLALAGAVAAAVYTNLGQTVRQQVSTTTYTTVCYGVCGLALLLVCLISGVQLTGFSTGAWLAIVALTVGPQLLGHSLFNYTLHKVSATTIGVILLVEVPGAALIGWLFLHQRVSGMAMLGIAVLLAGVAMVILSPGGRFDRRPLPASDL
ncbi:MAG TPA: EamA family transporter [Micromonosporaceae bacterium]|nr:EamA family transporter [Micromonosporaceae bacterium]